VSISPSGGDPEGIASLVRDGLLEESADDLYENAVSGYLSSLPDGTIVRANRTLLEWLGYAADELVGTRRLQDLLAPGARIYYETHYAPLLQMQGSVRGIAIELVRADGRRLPVLLSSLLVRDEEGVPRVVRTTAFDASERRLYERELLRARSDAESRARAAVALEHVVEGVVLVGESGDVQVLNEAAEAIFGVDASQVVGKKAAGWIEGWGELAACVPVSRRVEARAPAVLPLRRGDDERWLSASAVDADGGTVYTIRDVTDERALDQLRSDVIAVVSHELRTPLTGMAGAVRTLGARWDSLSPEERGMLIEMAVGQADRMTGILDQILLSSQLDTDNLRAAAEVFDSADLLDAVVRGVETGARSRIVVRGDAALALCGDLDRLRQALGNLVDNALKYSDGAVILAVERRERFGRVTVEDDGPGIAPGDRERIFEKFFRLDPAQRSGVGGTGLGLYIVRELVERMGGRVGLLPRPRGTTFFVDLPLGPPAA
jgi:PAS domain S-box-containing protein